MPSERAARIAELNDQFRLSGVGGQVVATAGVDERGGHFVTAAVADVRAHAEFTPENDPHGEHDFGAFELQGRRLFWKIDYYDRSVTVHSPDPADPEVTTRVLTIMLAEEY